MATQKNDNTDQAAFWSGAMGQTWVTEMAFIENMLAPFRDVLVGRVGNSGPHAVLDVGCGNGAVAASLSRRLGAGSTVVGIDISEPMIRNAQKLALQQPGGVTFVLGDAATHDFGGQRFDSVISRFGCMFFADPVAAFAHLRRCAVDDGALTLIAWRDIESNELFNAGIRAARVAFPDAPLPPRHGPGAFSFSDHDRVLEVLASAGWRNARLESLDVGCAFPESGLRMFVEELAPTGLQNASLNDADRKKLSRALHEAYLPFVADGFVRFQARAWLISARAGITSRGNVAQEAVKG
ncbi:MAG: class I SAM-dependent methyltransferase [Pseudomonadota bacterium]